MPRADELTRLRYGWFSHPLSIKVLFRGVKVFSDTSSEATVVNYLVLVLGAGGAGEHSPKPQWGLGAIFGPQPESPLVVEILDRSERVD